MADQVLVPFEGSGAGVEELAWGQREIWAKMQQTDTSLPIGVIRKTRAGETIESHAESLRMAVSRHEALRTRLRFEPDGRVFQVVETSGAVPMEIVDADDPDLAAQEIFHRYLTTNFDYANEWPVRRALVRSGGQLTHSVVMYCHLAADGGGVDALVRDLRRRLGSPGTADEPVDGLVPREQVRYQRTADGRRHGEVALRYWERLLRNVPPDRFPSLYQPMAPRYWEIRYRSPATYRAARLVAARSGVGTGPVLLAGFAVALSRLTGISPTVTQAVVNNRFRAGLADSVSPVSQFGLCVLDVAGSTFDEVVRRAWRSQLGAGLTAYYDPVQRDQLVETIGRQRGAEIDLSCYFNDRRQVSREAADGPGPLPSEDQVRAALPLSELRWEVGMDRYNDKLFFHINDEPDTIDVMACGDTRYLSAADLEACLRGFEAAVVEAALDPSARC